MTIRDYYSILAHIRSIIKDTEFEGHVFSVGGCERDRHLGREIKDIDLVLDIENGGIKFANWLQTNNYTKGSVVIFERFGTAMFHLAQFPEYELEAVQTRRENYSDKNSRKPETSYGTIQEDCKRRDFTINALYHNISTNEDLDLTGLGLKDIDDELIRTCGEPDIIFNDDPLRILRAIRFATQLKFGIDEDTQNGMKKNSHRLSIISKERIQSELNKILESEKPYYGFWTMDFLNITNYVFKNISSEALWAFTGKLIKVHDLDDYNGDRIVLSFVLLAEVIGLYNLTDMLHDLKYPNKTIDSVERYYWLLDNYRLFGNSFTKQIAHKLEYKCGDEETYNNIVSILKLDNISVLRTRKLMCGYKLPINGNDIMNYMGVKEGKDIKIYLSKYLNLAFKRPGITRFELILRMLLYWRFKL